MGHIKTPANARRCCSLHCRWYCNPWLAGMLLTVAAGAGAAGNGPEPMPARQAVTLSAPALTWPTPPEQVQRRILAAIARLQEEHARRQRYRLAIPTDAPLFPPDHWLQELPPDAGMAAWLALPPAQRAHDLLLKPDEDYFWDESGQQAGAGRGAASAAGLYAAQFLLHLRPQPAAGAGEGSSTSAGTGTGTAIYILQFQPVRRYGKSFHLLGRAGPGWYWDIRPAAVAAEVSQQQAARQQQRQGGRRRHAAARHESNIDASRGNEHGNKRGHQPGIKCGSTEAILVRNFMAAPFSAALPLAHASRNMWRG